MAVTTDARPPIVLVSWHDIVSALFLPLGEMSDRQLRVVTSSPTLVAYEGLEGVIYRRLPTHYANTDEGGEGAP